jgi:hypothetical protein
MQITHTVDLRNEVASAYGKETVWWPEQEKGQVVMDNLGLEQMADLVLDGMRVEKEPARVFHADWSRYYVYDIIDNNLEMKLIKFASRDAFITYEIATKCICKDGGRLSSQTESGS